MNEAHERRHHGELEGHASAAQAEGVSAGMQAAEAEGRPIDHRTARLIAERLHGGPGSALHAFALRGEVVGDEYAEQPAGALTELVQQQYEADADRLKWIDALAHHIASRVDRRPVRGWSDLTGGSELLQRSGPRIHVVSLDDEQAGRYLGVWLDADEDPDLLALAISELLEQSEADGLASWEVIDYQGFHGLDLFRLAEADGGMTIDFVSRVANGLAEHGAPFAALIDLEGAAQETCQSFDRRYHGKWASLQAYAEGCAEDFGWKERLDKLPEWLRRYVKIDYGMLASELRGNISVVESRGGGVYIFGDE